MSKRYPEWVNTEVVIKAMKKREEGILSKRLNLWIENLLEIDNKNNLLSKFFNILKAAIAAPYPLSMFITVIPGAQLESILFKAAIPFLLTPYPTETGTAIIG